MIAPEETMYVHEAGEGASGTNELGEKDSE